jgi:OOP family OmpA-OmpF porin
MKSLFAASLIATALAAGLAKAESNVLAAGEPVRSLFGACWQAGPWSELAADACNPTPVALAKRPVYETEVFFEFDRAELGDEGRKVLDDLARRLLQAELVGVVATAHADRLGGSHYNAMLSARRAEAIRAYLVEQGVPESVVQLDARGAAEPLTGGSCDGLGEARRTNAKLVACLQPDRRVEIQAGERR